MRLGQLEEGGRVTVRTARTLGSLLTISRHGPRDLPLISSEPGKPFSPAGFTNWFRDRCNEAGLPGLSAHGLRKAASTRAAENSATAHQL
jgi:integrase